MAWNSARPVPWTQLVKDWLLYVGLMAVVMLIVYRDRLSAGLFAGLFVSGPIFVLIGALLAKFGYKRKTLRDLRAESAGRAAAKAAQTRAANPASGQLQRTKPAPTRRTSTGPSRSSRPTSPSKRQR